MRVLCTSILILFVSTVFFAQDAKKERLTFDNDKLNDLPCEVVESYFEFKKYINVITNRTEVPTVRNSNKIALFRLLHPNFTIDETKGNRDGFIESLDKKVNEYKLLKRSYQNFDCPNVDDIYIGAIPLASDVYEELSKMNILLEDGSTIKTNRYVGFMMYEQTDLKSYNISSSIVGNESKGIDREPRIKKLDFVAYPLNIDEYVLKITKISDVTGRRVNRRVVRSKKDSTIVMRGLIPKASSFEPCCPQPRPKDKDGDGYSELVEPDTDDDSTIYPGAPEIVGDGIDQDLDGKDQLGYDEDKDGYYSSACKSPDPDVRLLCDCNDKDKNIYFRPLDTPESEWLNPTNGWNDDNCDCVKDRQIPFNWKPLNSSDFFIGGLGHLKRGKNPIVRNLYAYGYATIFVASTVIAVQSKINSKHHFNLHENAETFRISNDEYRLANQAHKRFLISTGIAIGTYAAQYFHLKYRDKKEQQYYDEIFELDEAKQLDSKYYCSITLSPNTSSGIGLGLFISLN